MKFQIMFGISAIAAVVSLAGCEDILPEYHPPDKIFEATFVKADTQTVRFTANFHDEYNVANYSLYFPEPTLPFSVIFSVKNVYEETIQMNASIKGTITLWPEANPTLRSIHNLSPSNIGVPSGYNPSTNTITLNPNAELFVSSKIDFKLTQGPYLHRFANEISRTIVSRSGRSCYEIMYEPVRVGIRMSIQLSDQLPAFVAEHYFPVKLQGIIVIPF